MHPDDHADLLDRWLDAAHPAARDAVIAAAPATAARTAALAAALSEPPGADAPDVRAAVLARIALRRIELADDARPDGAARADDARPSTWARFGAWRDVVFAPSVARWALGASIALLAVAVLAEGLGVDGARLAGAALPLRPWHLAAAAAAAAAGWAIVARRR